MLIPSNAKHFLLTLKTVDKIFFFNYNRGDHFENGSTERIVANEKWKHPNYVYIMLLLNSKRCFQICTRNVGKT